MDNADRRRDLRLAAQALDAALGMIRNARDKLVFAAERLSAAREPDPPEHGP